MTSTNVDVVLRHLAEVYSARRAFDSIPQDAPEDVIIDAETDCLKADDALWRAYGNGSISISTKVRSIWLDIAAFFVWGVAAFVSGYLFACAECFTNGRKFAFDHIAITPATVCEVHPERC